MHLHYDTDMCGMNSEKKTISVHDLFYFKIAPNVLRSFDDVQLYNHTVSARYSLFFCGKRIAAIMLFYEGEEVLLW